MAWKPKISKEKLKKLLEEYSAKLFSRPINELNAQEIDLLISTVMNAEVLDNNLHEAESMFSKRRTVIYLSIEFLIGRVTINNLINTGMKKMVEEILDEYHVDLGDIDELPDPALGNGGLGRLAACFMDSAATKKLPVYGFGNFYQYGLFDQKIVDNKQVEVPADWTKDGISWFKPDIDHEVVVTFRDTKVKAVPYVLPIVGYSDNPKVYDQQVFPLTLWKAERIDGTNDSAAQISDYLYPNDSSYEGKVLRLRQEYFFVSATLQMLFKIHKEKYGNLDNIEEYYCFQMNDTHPVIGCVEFIRLLMVEGYSFEEASKKAKMCFAYTNHTILSEALEVWDVNLFEGILQDCMDVIWKLNDELLKFLKWRPDFQKIDEYSSVPQNLLESLTWVNDYIITKKDGKVTVAQPDWDKIHPYELSRDGKVYMGRIACYIAFAINGVAKIHSEIIKKETLKEWYYLYPEKFYNCTNGITQRRWVKEANPYLSQILDECCGKSWVVDFERTSELLNYSNDEAFLKKYKAAKRQAKEDLAAYIKKIEGIDIDPDSIFDCQVKRIHMYKRQLMNAMRILYIYDGIKNGRINNFPSTTFIIGGKAASSYEDAKLTINLIKDIQDLVNGDPEMEGKMKVVFVTNFSVSYGEKIYSAANFSEQISTAGKEASGTGNMKFSENGALTIGTYDGANIEIFSKVGEERNYPFGAKVEDINLLKKSFSLQEFLYSVPEYRELVDKYLKSGILRSTHGDKYYYQRLISILTNFDEFFTMYDLPSYVEASLRAFYDYKKEEDTGDFKYHTKKAFETIGRLGGYFSSDRTLADYAVRWKIEPIAA